MPVPATKMPAHLDAEALARHRRGESVRALAAAYGVAAGTMQRRLKRAAAQAERDADARRLEVNADRRLLRADPDRTVARRPELSRLPPPEPEPDSEPILGHIVGADDGQGRHGLVARVTYRNQDGIAVDDVALLAACARARRERSAAIQTSPPSALHVHWVLRALAETPDRDDPRLADRSWRGYLVPSPPGDRGEHPYRCPVTTRHGRHWLYVLAGLHTVEQLARVIIRLEFDALAGQNGAPEFPAPVSEGLRERYRDLSRGQLVSSQEIPAPARTP